MFKKITPQQLTLLGVTISIEIFQNFCKKDAEVILKLLEVITYNLSVQLYYKDDTSFDVSDEVFP